MYTGVYQSDVATTRNGTTTCKIGTGPAGKLAEQFGYEVISFAPAKKLETTLCMSILGFDEVQYKPDEFAFVWKFSFAHSARMW